MNEHYKFVDGEIVGTTPEECVRCALEVEAAKPADLKPCPCGAPAKVGVSLLNEFMAWCSAWRGETHKHQDYSLAWTREDAIRLWNAGVEHEGGRG